MNAPRAEMELLKDAIEKKEEDLKCPICLETAKPPIFMCPNSHIICDACAPKVQTCPQCREKLPTPLKRLFSFFLFLLYSLSFLFAKAPLCWEKCHGDGCPAAEAGGTDWRLDWTGERSSNVTWCLSNSISFFIFNNHLQSKVVMMTHITKISLCHIFSLWAMCLLQVHGLSLSLHRKRRSSMVAGPSPTALSSTSCWSPVRGSRWWAGGGSSTEIFSQPLASLDHFQR